MSVFGPTPIAPPPRADYRTSLFDKPLCEADVRRLVRDELERMRGEGALVELEHRVTVKLCIQAAALVFDSTFDEIVSKRRTAPLLQARHAAMWAARKFTKASYPAIGHRMGGRDHSTVINGIRNVEEMAAVDADFAELIGELERAIAKVAA